MLYAQARQADGKENRNILLSELELQLKVAEKPDLANFLAIRSELPLKVANSIKVNIDEPATCVGGWAETEIAQLLENFNLAGDTSVSVLAVEMMPRYDQYIYKGPMASEGIRPLSQELGQYRILRTSRLVAAPEICCVSCD